MNKVIENKKENKIDNIVTISEMILENFDNERTAFIGHIKCRDSKDKLYLVCYDCIFQADAPEDNWDDSTLEFVIKKWVDIEISIIEKE